MATASSTTLLLVASLFMLALLTPAASAADRQTTGPIAVCAYDGNDVGVIYAGFGGVGLEVKFNGKCVLVESEQMCASCDGVEEEP